MTRYRARHTLTAITIIVLATVLLASIRQPTGQDTSYKNRGDRYEGVKQPQVGGYDIDLLSACADYKDVDSDLPAWLKVRFFLPRASVVNLIVRETEVKHNYWLDKAAPKGGWHEGFNDFAWPSDAVLKRISGIENMYDLGVVVRIGQEAPTPTELVSPAIFYHSNLPQSIGSYLFTFKTNGDARLTCAVYREGNLKTPVLKPVPFLKIKGGRSFDFQWDSGSAGDGWYRVVADGLFSESNDPINKIVRFYHRKMMTK